MPRMLLIPVSTATKPPRGAHPDLSTPCITDACCASGCRGCSRPWACPRTSHRRAPTSSPGLHILLLLLLLLLPCPPRDPHHPPSPPPPLLLFRKLDRSHTRSHYLSIDLTIDLSINPAIDLSEPVKIRSAPCASMSWWLCSAAQSSHWTSGGCSPQAASRIDTSCKNFGDGVALKLMQEIFSDSRLCQADT